jgi:type II secretory pathway component PulF
MDGRSAAGTVDADTRETAVQALLEQGLYVHEIREQRGRRPHEVDGQTYGTGVGQGLLSTIVSNIVPFVTIGELAMVTREFATAFGAGLPIDSALANLRQGVLSPLMRRALMDISRRVESGNSLADGMDRHPRVFNKMYRGMVRVGEGSGTLDEILKSLAEMFEEELELRRRVQGMMVYPGCIVVVLLAATFILGWLGQLPMRIFNMILFVLVFLAAFWLINKNRRVSRTLRTMASALPGIGTLIRRISIARTCFSLAVMIKGGVPYLQALDWARDAADLPFVENGLRHAYRDVAAGEPLSDSLTRAGIFPRIAQNLLKVGETAGSVDEMLFKIYQFMQSEINYQMRNFATMVGPTLLLILAVVVGFVVISFWTGYFNNILSALGD